MNKPTMILLASIFILVNTITLFLLHTKNMSTSWKVDLNARQTYKFQLTSCLGT
jgi:hypothetical protein